MKTSIKDGLSILKNKLLDVMFPSGLTCINCGAELTNKTRLNLCADCMSKLPTIEGHRCKICGVPILNEADYCDNCQKFDKYFEMVRAPLVYDDVAKDLVKKLKFGNKRYIADDLAKLMSDEFISEKLGGEIILYVPMTTSEIKERGFNQSFLLAKGVSERLNIPISDTLTKVRETERQKQLSRKERQENLKGVFKVLDENVVKKRDVLIIDDVYTTGTTINECAHVIKKAGARRVFALTACMAKFNVDGEKEDTADALHK